MRIEGKRVVVTGASSGIGRDLAMSLAGRGAALTIAARRGDRLEEVSREIAARHAGAEPAAVVCDVSNPEDVARLIGGTVERLGRLRQPVRSSWSPFSRTLPGLR